MAALARDDRRERRRTEATRSYDAERQNNGAPTRSYMSALLRINVGSCDLAEQGEEEQYVSLAVGSSTASVEFDQAAEVVVDLATPLPLVLKVLDRAAGDRELASATVDLRGVVPRWEDTAPAEDAAALSNGVANLACVDSEDGAVLRMAVEYERDGSLCFARRHKSLALADGDTVATRSKWDGRYHTAASAAVMSDGRHFAQFTVLRGRHVMVGVIRPGWDVGSGQGAQHVDGHCFFWFGVGTRFPGDSSWEGMQPSAEPGDRIGLLLDLEQGSMAVYKNDERLGVMVRSGLSGEYSWAVSLCETGESVHLKALQAP
jgi:hypothetical protein